MHPILGACPVCGETLGVTRLHCRSCDTTIEGNFVIGPFDRLSPEHLAFAELFIRKGGRLNAMATEMGISYPTLRARLNDLQRAMGFESENEQDEAAGVNDEERRKILDDLAAGKLSYDDAIKSLQG